MDKGPNEQNYRSTEDAVRNIKSVLSSPQWCLNTIKHIIGLNSSFNNEPKFNRRTLLQVMICDKRGTADMVSFLIEHNADVNAACYGGYLLLQALSQCSDKERQDIVNVLLEKGVQVPDKIYSESALSVAVQYGYGTDILKMIADRGADPNHINRHGQSVLCVALKTQQTLEILEYLRSLGATVTSCRLHLSPVHCIVCRSRLRSDVVQLMVQNGAKGNVVLEKHNGKTVIHYALRNCMYETEAMKILILSDESFNVGARDNRDSTMLHDALFNRYCELSMVKLLLDLGSGIASIDCDGDTPLHKAVLYHPNDPGFIRVLLKRGSPVNVANRTGDTALYLAYKMQQDLEILRLLMSSGELVFRHPVSDNRIQRMQPRTSMEIAQAVRQVLMAIAHRHQQSVVRRVRQPESSIPSLVQRVKQLSVSSSQIVRQPLMPVVQNVQQPPIAANMRLCNLDSPILSVALGRYAFNRNSRNLAYFQTLLKYSLLENPIMDVCSFIESHSNCSIDISEWIRYWYACLRDVERMARKRISDNLELINILGCDFVEPRRNCYDTLSDDHNKILLSIVSNREFPNYSEIIAAKLPYDFLQEVFSGIHMFTIKKSDLRDYEVTLNCNCLENMAKFLPYKELLIMILLFHKDYKQL